ncbi:MAG: DUF6611 family protein [Mycobacterium sp.]
MPSTQRRTVEPGVTELTPGGPPAPGLWSRLLDGAHPWGSFDATVGRYGVRRCRLIIYPAGKTTAERRLARLWRGWPVGGAVLGLIAVMLLGNVVSSPDAVLAVALVAYVSVGALLFVLGGPTRVRVRSMSVVLMAETADAHELCRYTEWQTLVHMLIRADNLLTTGAISPVEHEATWREAYDRLEGTTHV